MKRWQKMSKFKGFVFGMPIPDAAGFYFGVVAPAVGRS